MQCNFEALEVSLVEIMASVTNVFRHSKE